MTTLRIRVALAETELHCQWVLIGADGEMLRGQGAVEQLPRTARRVQLVVAAADVLLTRVRLPQGVARRGGAPLAYAVEDETLGEPDAQCVTWLGTDGDYDRLAVFDRQGMQRWIDALSGVGVEPDEVLCETLLLPIAPGEWSVGWNGLDGFVRTNQHEGAATDCGDGSAPVGLALMLDAAAAQDRSPGAIVIYATHPEAVPDPAVWQSELGIPVQIGPSWDWGSARCDAVINLVPPRRRWRYAGNGLSRFRPAAWILGAAFTIHVLALVTDWAMLAHERRAVQLQMGSRFLAVFPDTVSIVDPALQMRRKLAEERHRAGKPDGSDFVPMIDAVASAMRELPPGTIRVGSYETGRLTFELAAVDEARLRRMVAALRQSGLSVATTPRAGQAVLVTVRAS